MPTVSRDPSIPRPEPEAAAASLVDEIPVGLFRLDALGTTTWSNAAGRDLLRGADGAELGEWMPGLARRAAEVGGTVERRVSCPAGELKLLVSPSGDGFVAALTRDPVERWRSQARALRAMLAEVAAGANPLESAAQGLQALGRALPESRFALYGFAEDGQLVALARAGRPDRLGPDDALSPDELADRAVQSRQPVHVARILRAAGPAASRRGHAAGALALPVSVKGEVVGALYASGPMPVEGDLRLIQGFADAAGSLLERSRAERALQVERVARAESEAAAERAREVAVRREGLATLGQLVACVAHEINNPLAALRSNLRGLATGVEDLCQRAAGSEPGAGLDELAGELRELLSDSVAGLERMAGIIKTLKNLARRSPGRPAPFDPGVPVQDAVAVFRGARGGEARVELSLAGELPPVLGMPGALSQVLINLLDNAVDAMAGGGRVEVRARAEAGGVRIEVADDGAGIPAEVAPRIFEPWFTTKPAGKGTGLGLYICKEILEQMGGTIGFETGPAGTTFRIELPTASAGPEP